MIRASGKALRASAMARALGMPQAAKAAAWALSAGSVARSPSISPQLAPPAPATSTPAAPMAIRRWAVTAEIPAPVSLTMTGASRSRIRA
ncbi:hypothetical protein D3C75_1089600 [compost metagenome]